MLSSQQKAGFKTDNLRWSEGIAIVGMAARFPGCRSVDEYWRKVAAGESLLSQPTDEELRAAGVDPDLAEAQHFVRSGTHLEDAESFDAKFFDISKREAEILDPQQRIFLECAYEALEHAGMTGDGERVGVFAGIGMNTYLLQLLGNAEFLAAAGGYQLMLGNDKDFLATRVAYKLNLRGPAVGIQTACSTSLASVHLACQSLLSGESDAALAGGVSVMFPQVAGYQYIPGMILSPDGLCRPFDEKAHGTVPGRGAGIVVLKRVSDAVAAGDTIYGVIAGSAWNNDGSGKVGYTAPSVEGQAEVIRGAHAAAGITADRIGYVEAHGTGTELGDPIEIAALAEAFGVRPGGAKCVLGSVKSNMGHGDVAAGVAGLIKATMAVYHGVIPPTLNFERANPALGIEQTPFRVSAETEHWPQGEVERWAGVSSFGIGGTNVHLCLKSAPPVLKAISADGDGPWVFPVSAKTASALEAGVGRLAGAAEGLTDLAAAAATLQLGRRKFGFRRAVVAENSEELASALGKPRKGDAPGAEKKRVAFLFPGQGQQFAGMALELYSRDARFKELVDRGLAVVPGELADTILAVICDAAADIAEMGTSVAQPLLFLVEYALAVRWMELGVQPDVLVGHSLGELTAAAVAGVFSFEDGMRLAVTRGALMEETPAGRMLAVNLPVEDVNEFLDQDLWIAAENGPRLTVISGSVAAIEGLEKRLASRRVAAVRLKTNRAFHTPQMAEAAGKFEKAVAAVERKAPRLAWLSNVTGAWITAEEATSARYWADQITARVRFAENAAVLAKPEANFFLLEAGPGDALATLTRQQNKKLPFASSLGAPNRSGDDVRAFLETAAKVWECGADLRWEEMPGAPAHRRIALPTYPFERERFWVETKPAGQDSIQALASSAPVKVLGKRSDMASWFYAPTWQRTPAAALVLERRAEPVKTWLVLEDGGGFAARLAEGLEKGGAQVLRLAARRSDAAELHGFFEGFWREHRELLAGAPVGLVDCWTLQGGDGAGVDAGLGVYAGLLMLLQTAQPAKVRFAQMDFVAEGLAEISGEPVTGPGRGVLEGLARVVATEFPGVPTRVIDPGPVPDAEIARASGLVLAELATVAAPGITVAYRGGSRWQQVWQQVRLEGGPSKLRAGGTYVITGGLGGVGSVWAGHLMETYGANVAMVGRSALPAREGWEEWLTEHGPANSTSRRIVRAKELERLGGRLLLLSADVADEAAMRSVWTEAEKKFGAVHGVIHAAGIGGGARISAQDVRSAEELFRPKLAGSRVLAELAAGKEIDFLLFCSSISAVLPIGGDSAYAAANSFLDRYATWCRQHLGVPAVSLNLEAWREVGMAAEREIAPEFEYVRTERFKTAITPAEGVAIFERALASGEAQILVSTVDLQGLLPGVVDRMGGVQAALVAGTELDARKQLAAEPEGRAELWESGVREEQLSQAASEETRAVIAIWKDLLGAESVEAGDNFFELGGHSLLGTMVLARIREQFGVELSIRAIFDAPTPESLGDRIRESTPTVLRAQAVSASAGDTEDREEFEF